MMMSQVRWLGAGRTTSKTQVSDLATTAAMVAEALAADLHLY